MSNDRTLVILIPGFPENINDSTCLPAHQNLVRQINKQYPSIRLIILAFQYPFFKSAYEWSSNTIFSFGGKNRGGLSRRILWHRINNKLDRLKKENRIDAVLSFWAGECAYVGKRWAAKNGIKYFCWLMGQDAKKSNKYIKLARLTGSELIALSDFNADELRGNHGIDPSNIIPMGVSPQLFSTEKRNIDILCAGSLIPLKQYHIAIQIARDLKMHLPGLRMMITGEGPERKKLSVLINKNELEQNVLLAGEKGHDELLLLMSQSKLFLHPSSYEGLGMVCLEALAAGTPVISFVKPMNEPIKDWYVADSPSSMSAMALTLLKEDKTHEPVCPYPVEATVKKLVALLGF